MQNLHSSCVVGSLFEVENTEKNHFVRCESLTDAMVQTWEKIFFRPVLSSLIDEQRKIRGLLEVEEDGMLPLSAPNYRCIILMRCVRSLIYADSGPLSCFVK